MLHPAQHRTLHHQQHQPIGKDWVKRENDHEFVYNSPPCAQARWTSLSGFPGGRFQRTRIAEQPFLFDNADQATRAMWEISTEHPEAEFPGVKILAIHGHNPGQIHTTTATVKTSADLNGLRLRFPTEAGAAMVKALGGNPVGLLPGAVYENAEKGVIDGAVFTWDTMTAFNLAEVMKHHLDAKAYVTTFWFGINQSTYDGRSDEVKSCIDNQSGDALIGKFGGRWTQWDQAGYDRKPRDHHLSDDERTEWANDLTPMIDEYIANLEADGIDDARAIYDKLQAYTASH